MFRPRGGELAETSIFEKDTEFRGATIVTNKRTHSQRVQFR